MKEKNMKTIKKENQDEMRPEYDFDYSNAVRGKHRDSLLKEGSNIVVLEPDIARAFHDSATVNEALRSILKFTDSTLSLTKRSHEHIKTPRARS
jgi:hypothetical protein